MEITSHNKPDYKAPRFKKSAYNLLNRDIINKIKNNHPELKGLHEREFVRLVREFHEYYIDHLLCNRDPVVLPYNMGKMLVALYGKRKGIDRKLSNELGKTVYYRNANSEGYGAAYYYTTLGTYRANEEKNLWWFVPTTQAKGKLADKMKDDRNWKLYMFMHNRKYIKNLISIKYAIKSSAKKMESYNEFEISED